MSESVGERLARLEAGSAQYATKADLAHLESRLIKWLIGTMLAATASASAVATAVAELMN